MAGSKSAHLIVLDANPLLNNEPSISTLIARSEKLYTVPAVIEEIKDKNARSRLETTVLPFLTIRSPSSSSIQVVTEFARKTGDLAVLSRPDLQILALAFELECERNHGDWRLRKAPGQKGLNGRPPSEFSSQVTTAGHGVDTDHADNPENSTADMSLQDLGVETGTLPAIRQDAAISEDAHLTESTESEASIVKDVSSDDIVEPIENVELADEVDSDSSDSSDSDGWITPSNLQKHQANGQKSRTLPRVESVTMQVATITSDFAMQNVLLQMNLNLLSPSLLHIRHLKTYILRCHACFQKTKDMAKQFCPRCGKPTLTKVSCSTNSNGEFTLHLKKHMQWNTRGDRFSIPKPVPGSANGKVGLGKGGGKGGWGQELILAEDQKEYLQAMNGRNRKKERNLMDEDYLPGILTGERGRAGGRPKVGAGKNVNSKKR
ncbi:MAG: Nin1 binding protein [Icmadophila ericetorum]|nr:Nin1 binding protein [Icmadophila ericetorum]